MQDTKINYINLQMFYTNINYNLTNKASNSFINNIISNCKLIVKEN